MMIHYYGTDSPTEAFYAASKDTKSWSFAVMLCIRKTANDRLPYPIPFGIIEAMSSPRLHESRVRQTWPSRIHGDQG